MIKTFTQNDVLRYMYEDLEPEEKDAISTALILNSELMDFYIQAVETTDSLGAVQKIPSERTVENILNYSKSFICNSI